NLWIPDKANEFLEAEFHPDALNQLLTEPSTRLRKFPLHIPYPLKREQEVVVHLPDENWNLPLAENTIDNEAFTFRYQRKFSGRTVRFFYSCETKTNQIPAKTTAIYLK